MPGDGIGPEVMDAALAVLDAGLGGDAGFTLEFEHLAAGAAAWRDTGSAMSEEVFERAKAANAILLGAMGLPDVRHEDGTEIAPQLDLRFRLGLYAGVRPVKALPGGARPLSDPRGAGIDLVIVLESTEGLFASRGKGTVEYNRIARDTMVITRETCERLFDASFRLAVRCKARGGMGMAPSADIGDEHALFQPAHGSAPDIAGRGVANPIAAIQSAAMMLDWFAERHGLPECAEAGRRIDAAVADVLTEGRPRPVDLGGTDGTEAVTRAVVAALGAPS